MRGRLGVALSWAIGLTLSSVPAAAQTRLAILPAVVEGPHGAASVGRVFEATQTGVGLRFDLALLSYDELFLQGTTSRVKQAARCGSDEACIRRLLTETGADLGLRTIVNFALDPPLVTLSLVPIRADQPGTQSVTEAGPGRPWDVALGDAVARLMLQQGFAPAGRLEVRSTEPQAVMTLDGAGRRRADGDRVFLAAPGRYEVRAQTPDGRSGVAEAVVTAHQLTSVAVSLPAGGHARGNKGGILSSPWFWAGVGVIVVGAATAAVVVADPFGGDPAPGCLCITTPDGPCGTCP